MTAITRALISVSDKSGVIEFAKGLAKAGVEILSTGGTANILRENNIHVIEVGDYTGFPEMMDGRVKTLHPKVHGGILGRRGTDDEVMDKHGIGRIDLVAVNLYPFQQTVANPDCDLPTAIENIDIGGPTMIRAAAKNHKDVAVVVAGGYEWNVRHFVALRDPSATRTRLVSIDGMSFEPITSVMKTHPPTRREIEMFADSSGNAHVIERKFSPPVSPDDIAEV